MNKSGKSLSALYWEGLYFCTGFGAPALPQKEILTYSTTKRQWC